MKKFIKEYWLDILILLFCLVLPFIFFGTKLWVGGDTSKLYFFYPKDWQNNISNFAWMKFSGNGIQAAPFYLNPFLSLLRVVYWLKVPAFIVQNSFFASFLFASYFFQKKILKNINSDKTFSTIGASLYAFSPIFFATIYRSYLFSFWLVPLIPLNIYLYQKYQLKSKINFLIVIFLINFFFAPAFSAIPWLLAFLCCSLIWILLNKKYLLKNWKTLLIFLMTIAASQLFWIIPFMSQFLWKNSFVSNVIDSNESGNSLGLAIQVLTPGNNIFYPLGNLFHNSIVQRFHWNTRETFDIYYNNFLLINLFWPILIVYKLLHKPSRKLLIICFSLLISLFLFTINIEVFKEIFVWLGNIPGFLMFRNFYDKFAIGFVFFFSLTVTMAATNLGKIKNIIKVVTTFIVILNLIPLFSPHFLVKPIPYTKDIYPQISKVSEEYLDFLKIVKEEVNSGEVILNYPYTITSYTIVNGLEPNNYFFGRSSLAVFTGLNDIGGTHSLSALEAKDFEKYLIKADYDSLKEFFEEHNINYLLVNNKIDSDIYDYSYLIGHNLFAYQQNLFSPELGFELIHESSHKNYSLYALNSIDSYIELNDQALSYEVINPTLIKFKQTLVPTEEDNLVLKESFHSGWVIWPKLDSNHQANSKNHNKWKTSVFSQGDYYLFFFPQLLYYVGITLTMSYLIILIIVSNKKYL
jgi:hypothetical protein